jgi:hypothetical protein
MTETFYCCWCSRRKPLGAGYRAMSRNRKKCHDCQNKTREANHEHRQRTATR